MRRRGGGGAEAAAARAACPHSLLNFEFDARSAFSTRQRRPPRGSREHPTPPTCGADHRRPSGVKGARMGLRRVKGASAGFGIGVGCGFGIGASAPVPASSPPLPPRRRPPPLTPAHALAGWGFGGAPIGVAGLGVGGGCGVGGARLAARGAAPLSPSSAFRTPLSCSPLPLHPLHSLQSRSAGASASASARSTSTCAPSLPRSGPTAPRRCSRSGTRSAASRRSRARPAPRTRTAWRPSERGGANSLLLTCGRWVGSRRAPRH